VTVTQTGVDDTMELHLLAKASNRAKAEQGRLVPVKLNLDFRQTFGTQTIEAYERVLSPLVMVPVDPRESSET